jgi:curved DNA-binding protein CbpA
MKDYYRILGVLDDAEDIIIRAAYKALAQRYHPDKWRGDTDEANKKMSDINEAYDTLSDFNKRKKYDEEYFQNHPRNQAQEESEYADFEDMSYEDIEGWSIAESFFPDIKIHYNEIKRFSPLVANTFRSMLLVTRNFKNSKHLRDELESDYFERYYGSNKQIQRFAKSLLLGRHYKAAIQVNKIICVLGDAVTYQEIKSKIEDAFPDAIANLAAGNSEAERETLITSIRNNFLSPRELSNLYTKLYGGKLEVKNGLFTTAYVAVIDGEKVKLDPNSLVKKLLEKI